MAKKNKRKAASRKGPTPRRQPERASGRAGLGAVSATAKPRGKQKKQKPPAWQETMLFPRLRNHAKPAFVVLALVFGLGFVVFGVGSGSTGISNLFGNGGLFGSSSSAPSLSSLEKKTRDHPRQATAWRDLATAYEGKQRTADAVNALKRYKTLRPRDTGVLIELGGLYRSQEQDAQTKLQALQSQASGSLAGTPFAPTGKLGQALGTNPIDSAIQANLQSQATPLQNEYQQAAASEIAVYQQLVKQTPRDPQAYLQLGNTAAQQGQYPLAISAFTRFLKLAPQDPLAPQAKKYLVALKKLAKPSTATATTPSTTTTGK
jgi:Flp pilus assembly protein TadD